MLHLLDFVKSYDGISWHFVIVNSLWPGDTVRWHRSGWTLVQVMACCLPAPNHYPNQCWLIIIEVLWHSADDNCTGNVQDIYPCLRAASPRGCWVNSLWPSDAIWRQRSGSTLAQVMAWCLTAPSHYLNQCWLIISKIQSHSSDGNFTRDTSVIND